MRKFRLLEYNKIPFPEAFFGVSVSKKLEAFLRKHKNLFRSRFPRAGARKCGGLFLRKYKKSFLLRKYKKFFNLRVRIFFGVDFFFYFLELEMKGSVSRNMISYLRVSISWNIRSFFFGVSLSWIFLILEVRSSISWDIRKFFRGGFFSFFRAWTRKCGGLFWENIRNFLILELESSISRNIRNCFSGRIFLFWGGLVLKSVPDSPKVHYLYLL